MLSADTKQRSQLCTPKPLLASLNMCVLFYSILCTPTVKQQPLLCELQTIERYKEKTYGRMSMLVQLQIAAISEQHLSHLLPLFCVPL